MARVTPEEEKEELNHELLEVEILIQVLLI
jgi:hypothetical protein